MSVVLVVAAVVIAQVAPAASQSPQTPPASMAPASPGAPEANPPAPADNPPPPSEEPQGELPHWGLLLDAGLPDGFSLSAIYRPAHWFRASAGAAYNIVGYGVRGGVSFIPFESVVTPSLNLDGGHFFDADATEVLRRALPDVDLSAAGDIPRHVSYQYATASLGLEVGSPRRVVFYLRLGLSYMQSTIQGFEAILRTFDPTVEAKNPTLRATVPAAKLGIVLYF